MTLVETLIAVAVGGVILGAVASTSVELYKNLISAEAYSQVHEEARRAIALVSRDLRCGVDVTSTSSNALDLDTLNASGTTVGVHYFLQNNPSVPGTLLLMRRSGSAAAETLTQYATSVLFEYWANPGNPATSAASTFEVRVFLTITNVGNFRVSTDLLQTRVLMRNKHY